MLCQPLFLAPLRVEELEVVPVTPEELGPRRAAASKQRRWELRTTYGGGVAKRNKTRQEQNRNQCCYGTKQGKVVHALLKLSQRSVIFDPAAPQNINIESQAGICLFTILLLLI